MKTKPIWAVIAWWIAMGCGLLAAGAQAAETGLVTREWTIDGVVRKALVHIPAGATAVDTPLVFSFHGHGGSMANAARSFSFHTAWPEAIVIYMQGLPTVGALTDPKGELPGWQRSPGDYGDRDLKFFDAVVATVKQECKVDAKRVFAMGHSNGGGFTYLLWAVRGDLFAAVAPSASAPGLAWFRDLKPKPALHVAGTKDELVKYPMQERVMTAVRKLDGCEATGTPWAKAGVLTGTLYPSKTDTPFVSLIFPGAHQYPRETTALIVKFFKEHPGK